MALDTLQNIKEQINTLSLEEQLRLMTYLADAVRVAHRPRRRWLDVGGIAPDLLDGEDAQAWVSRSRQEDSRHREALLKQ